MPTFQHGDLIAYFLAVEANPAPFIRLQVASSQFLRREILDVLILAIIHEIRVDAL